MAARKGRQRCARIVAPGRQTIGGCWLHRLGTSSPAVFPCFSLFFFLFISSVDHSPPLAPHPDRPPTPHLSSFPLPRFLLRLSNCRSAASIISALAQLARKGREKLLVVVTLPPPPWHHKREGWREEGKGSSYSLLFVLSLLPFARILLSPLGVVLHHHDPAILLQTCFLLCSSYYYSILLPEACPVVALLAAGHFIVVALDATWLGFLVRFSYPRFSSSLVANARSPGPRNFCSAAWLVTVYESPFKTSFRVRNELTKNFCAEAVRVHRFLNLKELFLIVLCVFLLLTSNSKRMKRRVIKENFTGLLWQLKRMKS